jgi:ATP-dependent protease ClpP protease subunit
MEKPWQVEAVASPKKLEIAVHDMIGKSFFGDGISSKDVLAAIRSVPDAKEIHLRVNSNGGVVDEAKGIGNILAERAAAGVQVTGYVDGLAASAGSFLLTFASRVVMPSNTFQMVHQVRAGIRGTADEVEAASKLMRRMNDQLAEAYSAASFRRGKMRTKEEFLSLFAKGDTYMDADEAIVWGLADEKIEPLRAAACSIDLLGLSESAPATLREAPYVVSSEITNSIAQPEPAPRATAAAESSASEIRKNKMDAKELKASHPEVYAAVFEMGKEAGKADGLVEGRASELKRVNAHLKMAETTGAQKVAYEAIASGKNVGDDDVLADYHSAAIKRSAIAVREEDAAVAAAALAGAGGSSADGSSGAQAMDLGDRIVAELEASKGTVKK